MYYTWHIVWPYGIYLYLLVTLKEFAAGQAKQITVKPRPFRARWRHPSLGVSYLMKGM